MDENIEAKVDTEDVMVEVKESMEDVVEADAVDGTRVPSNAVANTTVPLTSALVAMVVTSPVES